MTLVEQLQGQNQGIPSMVLILQPNFKSNSMISIPLFDLTLKAMKCTSRIWSLKADFRTQQLMDARKKYCGQSTHGSSSSFFIMCFWGTRIPYPGGY